MGSDLAVGARPLDLVPGNPEDLDRLASRLSTFAVGMAEAADHLGSIKAGEWKGPAGDAFRTLIGEQPDKYDRAAFAFSQASTALSRYASALREAQADVQRAIHIHEQAERETQAWNREWDRHDAEVKAATASGAAPSSPRPAGTDPGAGDRARAQRLLDDARLVVDSQGRAAASALLDVQETAPKEPGLLDSVLGAAGDAWSAFTGFLALEDAGSWVADTWDDVSSWLEEVGRSLLEALASAPLVIAGGAMIVVGGVLIVGGVAIAVTTAGTLVWVVTPVAVGGAALVTLGGVIVHMAKGGKQNIRHKDFENLSEEEVSKRARDKNLSAEERERYRQEDKANKQRNKQKRGEK